VDRAGNEYTAPDDATPQELREVLGTGDFFEVPADATSDEVRQLLRGASSPPTAEAEQEGRGPFRRFAGGVWEEVNPVTIVKGTVQAVRHPLDTARGMFQAQERLQTGAKEALDRGAYGQAAAKVLASQMPLLGASADEAITAFLQGDWARGAGKLTGLGAMMGAPAAKPGSILRAGTQAVGRTARGQRLGGWLEQHAQQALVNEMVPKVGANKTRFGAKAAKIAGTVINEPSITKVSTFEGLRDAVYNKFSAVSQELDDAFAAHPELQRKVWNTPQVIRSLKEKLRDYTVETPKEKGIPSPGKDTVPPPWRPKAAVVREAITTLKQVGGEKGGLIRFNDLRKFRQAYDEWAMEKWWKSLAPDLLRKRGRATSAAQVSNVTREWLAQFAPDLKPKFQQWSVWRAARDIVDAVDEAERVRPTKRLAVEAAGGMLTGLAMGNPLHGLALSVIGPATDVAFVVGARGAHLRMAGLMHDLAKAIRTGDVVRQEALVARISDWTRKAAPVSILRPRTPTVTVPLAAEERPQE
jgi:hypothetical protein